MLTPLPLAPPPPPSPLPHVRQAAGELPGVHGRLADLGTVDPRYDEAVRAAAGATLENVVVDTVATAQACVAVLRERRLGVATFIILEQVARQCKSARHAMQRMRQGRVGRTSEGVQAQA